MLLLPKVKLGPLGRDRRNVALRRPLRLDAFRFKPLDHRRNRRELQLGRVVFGQRYGEPDRGRHVHVEPQHLLPRLPRAGQVRTVRLDLLFDLPRSDAALPDRRLHELGLRGLSELAELRHGGRGTWTRSSSSGYSYKLSGGVHAASWLGIDLSLDTQYASDGSLSYYLPRLARVCGDNNVPAYASKVRSAP